ncbi:MAG: 50S ribosomal protein L29 [Candidatus Gracilibacteria bacterium]|nr:50S ribosomal protein L29 [Candidatus Gracilibacteria bacterium]MDD2908848.1 50S ribosomal protein L29 [Candidatus Gracilibacteria bacterium]
MTGLKDNRALAQLDIDALQKELRKAQIEYYVLRMKHVANELKQTHLLKAHKSYIARLNTYLILN